MNGTLKKLLIILALFLFLNIAGCISLNINQKLHRDESSDISIHITADSQAFLNMGKNQIMNNLSSDWTYIEDERSFTIMQNNINLNSLKSLGTAGGIFSTAELKKELKFPYYYYTYSFIEPAATKTINEYDEKMKDLASLNYNLETFGDIVDTNGIIKNGTSVLFKLELYPNKDKKHFVVFKDFFLITWFEILIESIKGTPEKQTSTKSTQIQTQAVTPMPNVIITPTPTSTSKVIIEYSTTKVDKLTQFVQPEGPVYEYPSPGMTFLVINLRITNQGYQNILVNQFTWSLKASTKDNPNAFIEATKKFWGEADGIECKNAELKSGGWTTCKIPFEVPENYNEYKIDYNVGNNLNKEWIANPIMTAKVTPPAASMKTITNSIGMDFVLLPAGEFDMGSPSNEEERLYNEDPFHQVKISNAFYLGKYEVTQKQWRDIMGTNPSNFQGDDLPVEQVSWNDVQDFIKKLNEKEGVGKYRLPTEAEWEYSMRAGTTMRYSFGNDDSILGDYAWYNLNSGSKTHEIGQKKPNPWGLYDMHGNVWEWVQDIYHDNYSGAPTNGSSWESGDSTYRVLRGGSWYHRAEYSRSASRGYDTPEGHISRRGFRLLKVS